VVFFELHGGTGSRKDAANCLANFGTDAVTGNQNDFVGHGARVPSRRLPAAGKGAGMCTRNRRGGRSKRGEGGRRSPQTAQRRKTSPCVSALLQGSHRTISHPPGPGPPSSGYSRG